MSDRKKDIQKIIDEGLNLQPKKFKVDSNHPVRGVLQKIVDEHNEWVTDWGDPNRADGYFQETKDTFNNYVVKLNVSSDDPNLSLHFLFWYMGENAPNPNYNNTLFCNFTEEDNEGRERLIYTKQIPFKTGDNYVFLYDDINKFMSDAKKVYSDLLNEGLILPKKPIKERSDLIIITKIIETIDNWGNTETIKNIDELKTILKDSSMWTDDQLIISKYGSYFWDDLVGKNVMVKGDDEVILVTENDELDEGLNLQKKKKGFHVGDWVETLLPVGRDISGWFVGHGAIGKITGYIPTKGWYRVEFIYDHDTFEFSIEKNELRYVEVKDNDVVDNAIRKTTIHDRQIREGLNLPKKQLIKIKDIETGEISLWTIEEIIHEINRDRSADWTPFDESDWEEGWDEWVEGHFYTRHIDEPIKEGLNLQKKSRPDIVRSSFRKIIDYYGDCREKGGPDEGIDCAFMASDNHIINVKITTGGLIDYDAIWLETFPNMVNIIVTQHYDETSDRFETIQHDSIDLNDVINSSDLFDRVLQSVNSFKPRDLNEGLKLQKKQQYPPTEFEEIPLYGHRMDGRSMIWEVRRTLKLGDHVKWFEYSSGDKVNLSGVIVSFTTDPELHPRNDPSKPDYEPDDLKNTRVWVKLDETGEIYDTRAWIIGG